MNFSGMRADSPSADPHNLIGEFLKIVDRCLESTEHSPALNHNEENEDEKRKEHLGK